MMKCIYCNLKLDLDPYHNKYYEKVYICSSLLCGKLEISYLNNQIDKIVFIESVGIIHISTKSVILYVYGRANLYIEHLSKLSNVLLARELALKIINLNLFS